MCASEWQNAPLTSRDSHTPAAPPTPLPAPPEPWPSVSITSIHHQELAASIDQTLRNESRRVELRIAQVRAVALVLVACMDTFSYLNPRAAMQVDEIPLSMPLVSGTAALFSILILRVLRQSYTDRLRVLLPLLDGTIIFCGFTNAAWALGEEKFAAIGGLASIGMACMLFAASGALRLTRSSGMLTGIVALVAYSVYAFTLQQVSPNVGIQYALLIAVALLGMWSSDIVRRAVKAEVSRAMLSRFLPRRVVDQSHTDPMALLREAKAVEASVLVSDLRGFTTMCEGMTPAEAFDFLNEIQGTLAHVVRRNDGTVDKFMGDGILAVFGAPEPLTDHAARAVRSAWEMLEAIETINHARVATGRDPVRIGIGVDTGTVVTGCLGSGLRLEFTVIGDTVNIASRLESATKEAGTPVLLSEATLEHARQHPINDAGAAPTTVSLGDTAVRGRKGSIGVSAFEAHAPAPAVAPVSSA